MTDKEMSIMWKEEIEKGLQKVQELRERLKPVEFTSKLWEQYTGAYGDVREDVAFLFCPKELIPETEKIRRLDFEDKDSYEMASGTPKYVTSILSRCVSAICGTKEESSGSGFMCAARRILPLKRPLPAWGFYDDADASFLHCLL